MQYAAEMTRTDASDFGLPQGRIRVMFIAVNMCSSLLEPPPSDFFSRMQAQLIEVRHQCPDIYECMYDPTNESVGREMERFANKRPVEQDPAHQTWPETHMVFLKSEGIRWGTLKLQEPFASSAWAQFTTLREEEVYAYLQKKISPTVTADISQSIGRTPFLLKRGDKRVAPSMLPGTGLKHYISNKTMIISQPICKQICVSSQVLRHRYFLGVRCKYIAHWCVLIASLL